ncbi:MAG: glucose-6-phosphate isomerase, partial [Pseudomonadota bacterium]|nr:glucose-6-phosphate isomerase [Pseudomonadota bacterium]
MTQTWQKLAKHRADTAGVPILSLFDTANRFETFSVETDGLLLDYSKTALDATAMDLLEHLTAEAGLADRISAMFRGEKINTTEDRAVLHTALRATADTAIKVDGDDVLPAIRHTLQQMESFAEAIRTGTIRSSTGAKFTDVINIGIGGSDLGPAMATLALAPYHDGPACHFVSNVDGAHIADTLKGLDPQTTLVIVASKTFTTIETMTNAETAIRWLQATLGDKTPEHLAAVSTALDKTATFG